MSGKTDLMEFLELFERTARMKEIAQTLWSTTVIPLLSDRFQSTAVKLPAEVRDDYDRLKAALLERDESNVKNATATFWTYAKKRGVTALEHHQFVHRLIEHFLEGDNRASCVDSLLKEKTIQDLPKEDRTYIRERKPKTSLEVVKLAEEYFANKEESYAAWSSEQADHSNHNYKDSYRREKYPHKR